MAYVDGLRRQDALTRVQRSAHLASISRKGNRSTELPVIEFLQAEGIEGWEAHPSDILGRPDIVFRDKKLIIFVDGCFWHCCPECKRRIPQTRPDFWLAKLKGNRRRDARNTKKLREQGYRVLRLWEHRIHLGGWQAVVKRMLTLAARSAMVKSEMPDS